MNIESSGLCSKAINSISHALYMLVCEKLGEPSVLAILAHWGVTTESGRLCDDSDWVHNKLQIIFNGRFYWVEV